jgi:tRNA pseudouridine38-40 synthase
VTAGRRVRIELSYDGTDFHGWQVQPGTRTAQGTVEEALARIEGGATVRIRGASRTDAGVHARGQVADAAVSTELDDDRLLARLASILPADLRPRSVRTVPDSFHSRKDALAKIYRYWIDRSPSGDPLVARYAAHVPRLAERAEMEEALRLLPGRRDWSGFAGAASVVEDPVRSLTVARFDEVGPELAAFTFAADGFLNHMVRNLVGTLLDVARGRFRADRIAAILAASDRTLAGPTAPARALCLERVVYAGEDSAGAARGAPPPGAPRVVA